MATNKTMQAIKAGIKAGHSRISCDICLESSWCTRVYDFCFFCRHLRDGCRKETCGHYETLTFDFCGEFEPKPPWIMD